MLGLKRVLWRGTCVVRVGVRCMSNDTSRSRKLSLEEAKSITQTINERFRDENAALIETIVQIPNSLHECHHKFDDGMTLLEPVMEQTISQHGYSANGAGRQAFVEDLASFVVANPDELAEITTPFHSMVAACFNILPSKLSVIPQASMEGIVLSEIEELTSEAMTLLPSTIASQFRDRKQRLMVLHDFVGQLQVYAATAEEEVFGSGDEEDSVIWCRYHASLQLWLPTLRPELREELLQLRGKAFERLNRDPNW